MAPHASFSLLLSFFGPYQCTSKDGKRSFVPFAIIVLVGGEINGERVLELISYVGTSDVTT